MSRLRWTKTSRGDLRDIRSYIARDSAENARRFIERIKRAAEGLTTFPAAGAMVPEWQRTDVREVFVGDYRVIYRIIPGVVQVLTVIHGARRLPDLGL